MRSSEHTFLHGLKDNIEGKKKKAVVWTMPLKWDMTPWSLIIWSFRKWKILNPELQEFNITLMQGSTSLKNEVKLPSLDTSFRIDITIFFLIWSFHGYIGMKIQSLCSYDDWKQRNQKKHLWRLSLYLNLLHVQCLTL